MLLWAVALECLTCVNGDTLKAKVARVGLNVLIAVRAVLQLEYQLAEVLPRLAIKQTVVGLEHAIRPYAHKL